MARHTGEDELFPGGPVTGPPEWPKIPEKEEKATDSDKN